MIRWNFGGSRYKRTGAQALTYDPNGNLTNYDAKVFTYDVFNRLVEVRSNGQAVAQYVYDALNRRTEKIVGAQTTFSYYSGDDLIEEVTGGQTNRYVYQDAIDSPVAMIRGAAVYYYLRDWQNNVKAVADAGGALVEYYVYSLFGRTEIFDANSVTQAQSIVGNPFGFGGQMVSCRLPSRGNLRRRT